MPISRETRFDFIGKLDLDQNFILEGFEFFHRIGALSFSCSLFARIFYTVPLFNEHSSWEQCLLVIVAVVDEESWLSSALLLESCEVRSPGVSVVRFELDFVPPLRFESDFLLNEETRHNQLNLPIRFSFVHRDVHLVEQFFGFLRAFLQNIGLSPGVPSKAERRHLEKWISERVTSCSTHRSEWSIANRWFLHQVWFPEPRRRIELNRRRFQVFDWP